MSEMSSSSEPEPKLQDKKDKWKHRVGSLALTLLVAFGVTESIKLASRLDREDQGERKEVVQLDETERQRIEQAAIEQSLHLLHPETGLFERQVKGCELSFSENEFTLVGHEYFHGNGARLDSTIEYTGVPTGGADEAVTAFLGASPKVKEVTVNYSNHFQQFKVGLIIDEHNILTVSSPDAPGGKTINEPGEDFNKLSPVEKAVAIAAGLQYVARWTS